MTRPRRLLAPVLALSPALLVGGAVAFSPTPEGWVYPLGQRMLYVHVPLAWVAYAGFLLAVIAAAFVLVGGSREAGRWMRAANETTTVFAIGALGAGLAWSYEFDLYDPLADPKVLATVVLVAVLGGLWTLAASAPAGRRDVLVAVSTVVGFVAVPASYLASRLSIHPDFVGPTFSISDRMLGLLLLASLGFTLLYAAIVWTRARLMRLEEAIARW